MNLGTMKTALRRYAGVDATDPLVDWINAALTEFVEAYPWPFLEVSTLAGCVAGSPGLSWAGDSFNSYKILTIRQTTEPTALTYMPITQFEEDISDQTVTGKPQLYTLVGNEGIFLWPVPDSSSYIYRIRYQLSVPDLAADIDEPQIPARYHYTIVEGAAVRALQAESEEERAASARSIFEDSIDRHITAIGGRKQEGSYNQVRDVMGYGS